ncbi:hypothetical protein CANINC_003303 [Pichia inconspicua]|uniref:Uncharacterized protein n=1 Tax=Pichia inconspicua TaxID=52247 RepID=A0A4V6TTQ7_9ASCO|nr:hypothetical protein CANINC_003303 [[Candida] inconspicua]
MRAPVRFWTTKLQFAKLKPKFKDVGVVATDLVVDVVNFKLDANNSNNKDELEEDQKNDEKNDETEYNQFTERLFDPDMPITMNIKNKRIRRLARWLIAYIPKLTFQIKSMCILLNQDLCVVAENLTGKLDIHEQKSMTAFSNKVKDKNYVWSSGVDFQNVYLYDQTSNRTLAKFFENCNASFNFRIDNHSMRIFNFEPALSFTEIDFSMVYISKIMKLLHSKFQINKKNDSNNSRQISKQNLRLCGFIYHLVKSAKLNFQSLKISEIPLFKAEIIDKVFSTQNFSLNGVMFVSLKLDSLSLNAAPIDSTQVGFSLKFVEQSFPLQWILTVVNTKLSVDYSNLKDYTGAIKQVNIVSVPNLLIRIESTMLINFLRALFDGDSHSLSFKDKQTLASVQITLTSPVVDISVEQLMSLVKVNHEIRKHRKREKKNSDSSDKSESLELLKDYLGIILGTHPRVELNVLIEKPLLLFKSENDNSDYKVMHLLVVQTSMISLICDAKTHLRSLLTNLKANIPDLTLSYQRNNNLCTSEPVFTVRDISFITSMQLLSLKNLKCRIDIFKVEINLTNIMALNGLGIIFNMIRLFSMKLKVPKEQYREPIKHKDENLGLIFRELPSWFCSLIIKVELFKFKAGSKSIFIDVEHLLDETDSNNYIIEGRPYAPASSTIKFSDFNIAVKAKSNVGGPDDQSVTVSQKTRDLDDFYWDMDVKISKSEVFTHSRDHDIEHGKRNIVLSIPTVTTKIYWLKHNICEICTQVETLTIDHNLSSHFILFSTIFLLKNTFSYHRRLLFPDNFMSNSFDTHSKTKSAHTPDESRFTYVHFKWKIRELQIKMAMPEKVHLRLDMYHLTGKFKENMIVVNNRLVRLSVKKEPDLMLYSRLLVVETLNLVAELPRQVHEMAKIYVKDKSIRVTIPSNFIVHSLFEAITLTVKLTKNFLKVIKFGVSRERDKITPSGVIELPYLKLKSKTLAFVIEDDPFESELNMIYQLGLLEQRSRLEKQKQFDTVMVNVKENLLKETSNNYLRRIIEDRFETMNTAVSSTDFEGLNGSIDATLITCYKKLHRLRVNISKSWIEIVDEFKIKRKSILERNMKFFSNEILFKKMVSSNFNHGVYEFNNYPPLTSILLDQVLITITPPQFPLDGNSVQKFINRIGKGVPLDTCWDKIVPMDISLQTSELRMHLKDFPLPMVYVPKSRNKTIRSFTLNAKLAIAERAPYSDTEYWYKFIPMYQSVHEDSDSYEKYSYYAPKTVTSVKTYYEADCLINNEESTSITWSMGYQPILRQLNISFDSFSKESRDPSPKLGVWDKMRNILHGFVKIKWVNQDSDVMVNIPNSSDPYKFRLHSAGFSLIFKRNVSWLINDPTRENERDYFIFRSDSIVFGIPDHLSRPLPCWSSNDLVSLSIDNKDSLFISIFGYYLNKQAFYSDTTSEHRVKSTNDTQFKTRNIALEGDIELKLSVTFQRLLNSGEITENFKSHYQNVLTCPEYIKENEVHDSYSGFRSNFIHMALNLKAHGSLNNILRISPKAVYEFINWFKLFSGDLSLPIRNGKLWGERTPSVNIGSHLKTFKFSFDVEPLFIYHGYRVDLAKPDNKSVIALKARIGSFHCDLHERKEKMIEHVDFLNESRSIEKMGFYIGKVDISDLDLRVIGLKFGDAVDHNNPSCKFEIFDNDDSWISLEDFNELKMKSIENCDITGQVLPVLYAANFTYWMNKELSENKFGNELSHDCSIKTAEFPERNFNHIFDLDHLKMKWYREARNLIFEYISELDYRAAYAFGTSYKARSEIIGKLQKSKLTVSDSDDVDEISQLGLKLETANDFDKALRNSRYNFSKVVPVDDFLVRLKDIQIQIMVDSEAESLMLFRTKYNEIEIVTLRDDGWYEQVKQIEHAQRFGTTFKDADLIAISRNEYYTLNKSAKHYGTEKEWPPFLVGDEPDEFITSKTILSDVLIYFIFEKSSNTYSGGKSRNKLRLHIPKLKTKIDSATYLSFFTIATKVLMYISPQQKAFAEMVQAISIANDTENLGGFVKKLEDIWIENSKLESISEALTSLEVNANDSELDTLIKLEQSRIFFSSVLLLKLFSLNSNPEFSQGDDDCFMEWSISADQLDMELIDRGLSFMNLSIQQGAFTRLEMLDGSSHNKVVISQIKILNSAHNILFPETLTAYDVPDSEGNMCSNFVECSWQLGEKRRGMTNIKNIDIKCSPMKICLEDSTGLKLIDFFFPRELNEGHGEVSDGPSFKSEEYDLNETLLDDSTDEEVFSENSSKLNVELRKSIKKTKEGENIELAEEEVYSDSLISSNSLHHVRSETSVVTETSKIIDNKYSRKLNQQIIDDNHVGVNSVIENLIKLGLNSDKNLSSSSAQNIIKLSEKAKEYFVIGRLYMGDFILNITFSGRGKFRLMNVNNLSLKIPKYVVNQKLWTSLDIINSIKKHVIKTLLKQTGKLLTNKMFVYKRHKRVNIHKKRRS